MAELTDPNIPAANKNNIVTPGFSPDEAQTIDDHLNQMNGRGLLPLNLYWDNARRWEALGKELVCPHGSQTDRALARSRSIALRVECAHRLLAWPVAKMRRNVLAGLERRCANVLAGLDTERRQ